MTQKEFGKAVIKSLTEEPEKWRFTYYTANCGRFSMWTGTQGPLIHCFGNKHEYPIGTFWQRIKIRRLVKELAYRRSIQMIKEA